jgi:hypothetical protein
LKPSVRRWWEVCALLRHHAGWATLRCEFALRYPSPAYYNFILDSFDELQRLVPSD